MNKAINKFSLTGDKCMLKFHLQKPRFTYSLCEQFTEHHEKIQKIQRNIMKRKRNNNRTIDLYGYNNTYLLIFFVEFGFFSN